MQTKLHKTLFLVVLLFVGIQSVNAQNYFGLPFGGKARKIGNTIGVGDRLELENFDGIASNVDGANYGGAQENGVIATYWDKSAGSTGNSTYRSGSDVDINEITYDGGSTGYVIAGNQGSEFQMFTIEVVQSGEYTASLNYKHGNANNKRFQIVLHAPDDVESAVKTLFNTQTATPNPALPRTDGGGTAVFMDSAETLPFTLTKGTWLIRSRTLDAGLETDYITFTLKTATLSTESEEFNNNALKAFPNPSSNGLFELNIESKWSVYSILGVQLKKGEGKSVDLSSFAKGTYILKTPNTSKMLMNN